MLERIGVLSPTMSVTPGGLLFDSPAIGDHELPVVVVGSLYAVALITGASVIGEILRTRTRAAHRHLLMQAWQLRQLVPQAPIAAAT
jgi:hypothetical protein